MPQNSTSSPSSEENFTEVCYTAQFLEGRAKQLRAKANTEPRSPLGDAYVLAATEVSSALRGHSERCAICYQRDEAEARRHLAELQR